MYVIISNSSFNQEEVILEKKSKNFVFNINFIFSSELEVSQLMIGKTKSDTTNWYYSKIHLIGSRLMLSAAHCNQLSNGAFIKETTLK